MIDDIQQVREAWCDKELELQDTRWQTAFEETKHNVCSSELYAFDSCRQGLWWEDELMYRMSYGCTRRAPSP